jgi:branched-chain amino acid transport system substrate-binding protein
VVSTGIAPASIASEWVWRAAAVEGEAGTALSTYARGVGERAYVLHDPDPSAQAEVTGFTRAFVAAGGTIAGTSTGMDAFGAQLHAAESAGADTIFAAYIGDAAAQLLAAYRTSGVSARLIAPASLTEFIDLSKVGPLPHSVYTSSFYAADLDNEDNRRFVASYQNTHGGAPSSLAMAAYDGAGLLDRALRLVQGDLTPTRLRDAFKVLGQVSSPRGTWAFNISRGPQQTWYLRRLRLDGQVPANMLDSDLAVLS